MKIKLPLYAKILCWFFLNLVFLGIIFFAVARVQFRFGLDSLISGPAGENLQKVIQLLSSDLRESSNDKWNGLLKRFGETYHVQFYLFRGNDQIAGDNVQIPAEVHDRMPPTRRPGNNPPPRLRGEDDGPGLRGGPPEQPNPEVLGQQERPPQKAMVHTSSPNRYWVISHVVLPDREHAGPEPDRPRLMPATLLVVSDSLSAGGLFFDVKPWIIGGIAVVIISLVFWFPLVRGITRAVSQMTQATEKIAEGRFDVRSQVNRKDELGALSDSINQMAMRLSGFVNGQKRFLGDIAHELCSPIARTQVALGILEQRADAKQMEYLKDLREEVEQMSSLVNELLSFSKAALGATAVKLKPVSVRALVEKAVSRECHAADSAQIKIDVADDLQVLADADLCLRALANILRNAIRYAAKAGPISISAARDGDKILVAIDDCGPGIPEDAIPQIFDPFFRVDTSRDRETGGVGLGLAIVKTCVESCGGQVGCENRQPSGLRVVVSLPAAVNE